MRSAVGLGTTECMTIVQWVVAAVISFGMLVLGLAILAAMRMRNVDPVGRLAALFAPSASPNAPVMGATT